MSIIISPYSIYKKTIDSPFIIGIQTNAIDVTDDGNQFTIFTDLNYTYDYSVDWGDGTISSNVTGDITKTYDTPGLYDIKINGIFPYFTLYDKIDRFKLLSVKQWGDIVWESFDKTFSYCSNLTSVSETDSPNLALVTNLSSMFSNATNFNSDLSNWDVSSVINMTNMFADAANFNGDISNWNVSSVTRMTNMFVRAYSFNRDLSNWDVSNVTEMTSMFYDALSFNSDLSGWCVTNIPVEPNGFSTNTPSWVLPKPIWGTCPV